MFPGTCSLLFVCFTLFDLCNDGEGACRRLHLIDSIHQLLVIVDGEHHAVLVQPVEVDRLLLIHLRPATK